MSQFRLARLGLLLAAIGLTATPALLPAAHAQAKPEAAAAEKKPDTIRADMFKLLDPKVIQPLLAEKKFDQAKDNLAKADAFPEKTEYEMYVIDRMKLALASASGDDAATVVALEKVLKSPRLTPDEASNFKLALAERYYNAHDYAKAIVVLQDYLKTTATPHPAARTMLSRSYYLSKDYAKALPDLKAAVADAEKAGKAPTQEDLRLLASAAAQVKDNDTTQYALEKMAAYYPSEDTWSSLLGRLMNRKGFDQRLSADVFRLEFASSQQMEAGYYVELAELDLSAGFPTEAKKVVDAGYAAGVLGKGVDAAAHKKLRDRANKGAADDAKNIGSGEAAAAKKPDGVGLLNLGYAYVTMDQFEKGLDLMQKGIAKGLKRPEDGKILLGIAYYKAGRKDDAIKTFNSVEGDPIAKDLARYWSMFVAGPSTTAVK